MKKEIKENYFKISDEKTTYCYLSNKFKETMFKVLNNEITERF